MAWLDDVERLGRAKVRKSRKQRLQIHTVLVTVRPASDSGDPGEVATGYYVVEPDGSLQLVTQDGAPLDNSPPVPLDNPEAARAVAGSLIQKRWQETRGDFNRRLVYRPLGNY